MRKGRSLKVEGLMARLAASYDSENDEENEVDEGSAVE